MNLIFLHFVLRQQTSDVTDGTKPLGLTDDERAALSAVASDYLHTTRNVLAARKIGVAIGLCQAGARWRATKDAKRNAWAQATYPETLTPLGTPAARANR
jgi:hypothetical protein